MDARRYSSLRFRASLTACKSSRHHATILELPALGRIQGAQCLDGLRRVSAMKYPWPYGPGTSHFDCLDNEVQLESGRVIGMCRDRLTN